MKINFGLLGLGLAQSGDYEGDGERGYDYDYNLGNHYHTHNSHNHYASSDGYGYGDQTYQFNSYGGKAGLNENVIVSRKIILSTLCFLYYILINRTNIYKFEKLRLTDCRAGTPTTCEI